MQSTASIVDTITQYYPTIRLEAGDDFVWNPTDRVITYNPDDPLFTARILHEVGHAELQHTIYETDIELLQIERDAWHHAKTVLSPRFSLHITSDIVEDDLDTYRDWLHSRSLCPHCKQNGVQSAAHEYTCLICQTKWKVNTAIGCALRRYIQKNTP
ncbi:MAG TPA: hypothetical protein VGE13_03910 [Candidatus Saccharimonadales bacterium]